MSFKYLLLTAISCSLLLTGCSTASPIANSPTVQTSAPTATNTPTPVLPQKFDLTPLSMKEAWGNVAVSTFSLTMGDHLFISVGDNTQNSLSDDTQMCGMSIPWGGLTATTVYTVGTVSLLTGKITLLTDLEPGYQSYYCTMTGRWVIWVQVYGSDAAASIWSMSAINRDTHEIRLLDKSQPTSDSHTSVLPHPIADQGRVVWMTYSEQTPRKTQVELYDFATGNKQVVKDQAGFPTLSWPWVSWTDSKGIVFHNLETQQTIPLNEQPITFAFGAGGFAFSNTDYSQMSFYPNVLTDQARKIILATKDADGGFVQFPSLNDRLVAWGNPNTVLVYDRKLGRRVAIDTLDPQYSGSYVASHYLIWTGPASPADLTAAKNKQPYHLEMHIIDTNTLP